MRKLHNQYLNDNFYKKEIEPEFDIDSDEVKLIVSSPFAYAKEQMERDILPTIRLKYLGTFVVYTGRARAILERTEQQYQKGTITKALYEKRKKTLVDFIKVREELEAEDK